MGCQEMPKTLKNLKPLRLICAISVVLSHSFSVISGNHLDEPFQETTGYSLGTYSVLMFFSISGIVIPLSLEKNNNLFYFWTRRVLRIFPALIICVLATAFILGPAVSVLYLGTYLSSPQVWSYVLGAISLLSTSQKLPGVYETLPDAGQINVPLWTLKYEMLAWLCAAILFGLLRAKLSLIMILMVLIILSFFCLGVLIAPRLGEQILNIQMFLFAFFCTAILSRVIINSKTAIWAGIVSAVITMNFIATPIWLPAIIFTLALVTLAIAYASPVPILSTKLQGDYSYGIYIFAYPIQQFLVFIDPDIDVLFHFSATLIICFPIAFCSWHFLESKAVNLLKAPER